MENSNIHVYELNIVYEDYSFKIHFKFKVKLIKFN